MRLRDLLLSALLSFPAQCQILSQEILEQPRFEFEARYWLNTSSIQWKQQTTEFDFNKDLRMGNANLPDLRFSYFMEGKSIVRFGYAQATGYDGQTALARPLVFNGKTFAAGTQVASHAEFRQLRLSYIYEFVRTRDSKFRLGVLVDGYGFQQKTTLNGSTDDRWFGMPGLGAAMAIRPVKRIEVFAEGSGMGMGSWGFQGGGEAGARVLAFKHVVGTVGYRMLRTRPAARSTEYPYVN